jgi:ATP-dependent Lon protease
VILPERNRGDLDDIPEEIREQMTFHPVMTIQEVLDVAPEIGGAPLPVRVTGSR